MSSVFSFLKSKLEKPLTPEKTKPLTPEKPKPPTPEKLKTPNKIFSMSRISNLFKSEPQEEKISTREEVISEPIFTKNSNNDANDEYQRIKNNFLEEIQLKIQTFWGLNESCKTECINNINDEIAKKQLDNMYRTAASGDFLSMCGRINSNISQCNEAIILQRAIQNLFILYKTDTTHDISQVVLDEELEFYKKTKTKIMKWSNGGRKTRLTKRKTKKTKTQKRQKRQK